MGGIKMYRIFAFFCVISLWSQVSTGAEKAWTTWYEGSFSGWNGVSALAVDTTGNIYVTASSLVTGTEADYATVKYDPEGNELWVVFYDGPESGWDEPSALALDSAGNVYVTGLSSGLGTGDDFATVKYDPEGNELWVARYDGPGPGREIATALAIDSAGNVYVTGLSGGLETGDDYATIKYDSDGNELWVVRYDGPESGFETPMALAVDPSGNVYVTGYSSGSGAGWDFITVKYDPRGNKLWVARYEGPEGGNDLAFELALDPAGNVYVMGWSGAECERGCRGGTYTIVKYDSEGNELWVARYDNPEGVTDEPTAMAVDSDGNVYVMGLSGVSWPNGDYATVKYDSQGNELWVARYGGGGPARALAIDQTGNVYVTGNSGTAKYDRDGEERWVTGSEYPGNEIAIDTDGNACIAGELGTVKYDPEGDALWVASYDEPLVTEDTATALAVDSVGNIYITGRSDDDYATVKVSPEGKRLWVARYDGAWSDQAMALAVDPDGNVYVTGSSWTFTSLDYATVKYDSDGNELWVARYDGPEGDRVEARAVAIDGAGNVYVTGSGKRYCPEPDTPGGGGASCRGRFTTIKYDADGNELWVAQGPEGPGGGTALAVDGMGSAYVASGWYTVKYDSQGNELWVARGPDQATAIAMDHAGDVYVTGVEIECPIGVPCGRVEDHDYATFKYDPDGNVLWEARHDGPDNWDRDDAAGLALDPDGNVYVTGSSGTVKYDAGGNELWARGPGGNALSIDAAGNAYVAGSVTVKFDPWGNELWRIEREGIALKLDSAGNVYVVGHDSTTVKYVPERFIRGDADGNRKLELTDAIKALTFQFLGGVDLDCIDAADVDDSGVLDLSDAIRSLNYQFTGTAEAPEPPGPFECGIDPTIDNIECQNYSGCD